MSEAVLLFAAVWTGSQGTAAGGGDCISRGSFQGSFHAAAATSYGAADGGLPRDALHGDGQKHGGNIGAPRWIA